MRPGSTKVLGLGPVRVSRIGFAKTFSVLCPSVCPWEFWLVWEPWVVLEQVRDPVWEPWESIFFGNQLFNFFKSRSVCYSILNGFGSPSTPHTRLSPPLGSPDLPSLAFRRPTFCMEIRYSAMPTGSHRLLPGKKNRPKFTWALHLRVSVLGWVAVNHLPMMGTQKYRVFTETGDFWELLRGNVH